MKPPYYAALNPDPSYYAKRWAVFYRFDGGEVRRTGDQFATRKAAERCAERWNDAERDPENPAW